MLTQYFLNVTEIVVSWRHRTAVALGTAGLGGLLARTRLEHRYPAGNQEQKDRDTKQDDPEPGLRREHEAGGEVDDRRAEPAYQANRVDQPRGYREQGPSDAPYAAARPFLPPGNDAQHNTDGADSQTDWEGGNIQPGTHSRLPRDRRRAATGVINLIVA